MSIDAATMRLMADGGASIDDMIVVARAMECGPDRGSIAAMIEDLRAEQSPANAIAVAAMAMARHILSEREAYLRARPRNDNAPRTGKCGNRQRRGMNDYAWRKLRQEIFDRDGSECQYCGSFDDLTCDHIVPLIRGGTNDHDNLTTACRSCNSSKGDKLVEEWVA
jgi:hypothetical protein